MPPATINQRTLDNGLTLIWEQDRRQPLVALEVRILGGLRGEGKYLGTGITHFLEHMLFKGTETRAPGTLDHEVRAYGGSINAFTSHDFTGVSLYVDSHYLREALFMLADILQHATFPPEEFAKERPVVISELQMNKDDPERRIRDLFWNTHFLQHPYRHPILGYQPLLESLTVEDLRAYYHAQYVPNNIVIACVGDVDPEGFSGLAEEAFGSWPRRAPYQITVPAEPPPVSQKRGLETLPVQASYVMLGFASIRLADPDLYPLDVLASILGQGRSSRLYEELVRKRRVAQVVSSGNYTPFDPGTFSVYLRTDPTQTSQAIDAALELIDEIKRTGVSAQELKKAKRQVAADYVFQHQTVESTAYELASSFAMTGDPEYSKRYVEQIDRVTAEQVKQVAGRYLDRSTMTLALIQPPQAKAAESKPAASDQPDVTKTMLANGVTVLLGVDRHLPLGSIVVMSRGGVRAETEATQGLSNLTAQLLLKGTARRNASEIAAYVESLGGELGAFSGRDAFGVSLDLLSSDVGEGIALISELLSQSTFPEEELTLQRQLIVKELEARDDDMFDLASRLLRRTLFATHPYRFDPLGSKETVQRLTRQRCVEFATQWLAPSNLVIAVFGDIDRDRVLEDLRGRFGQWPKREVVWPMEVPAEPLEGVREASRNLQKEQNVILIGFRGTRVTSSDRFTVDVMTAILSGMSGRLFQTIREQQGLSYTLGASSTPGWDPGYVSVYAATRPEERDKTLAALHEQLRLMAEGGVRDDELARAERFLIGEHRMELQRISGLARRAVMDELYGTGFDAWMHYEDRINAVTTAMVQDVARRYLTLGHRAEVVLGPNVPTALPHVEPALIHDGR